MFSKVLVSLSLLLSCQAALAQANLTPRQVYENYRQASANKEDVSQFLLESSDAAKQTEADKKEAANPLDQKTKREYLEKLFGTKISKDIVFSTESVTAAHKDEIFLTESLESDNGRLLYGQGYGKEGYTEIEMQKAHGAWKIKRIVFHANTKPPVNFTSQKLFNAAYAATARQFPQVPVHGKIGGIDFKPKEIKIWDKDKPALSFSYPSYNKSDKDIFVYIFTRKKSLINTRMSQTELPPVGSDRLSVWVCEKEKEVKVLDPGQFGIQLVFSPKNAQGLVPGYIILQTIDPGTYIEGYFYAKPVE